MQNLTDKSNHLSLILGSGSPRRKELLSQLWEGDIKVVKSDVEEIYPTDLEIEKVPEYLSQLKANDILKNYDIEDNILITADTIVILQGRVLGKPIDRNDAIQMLESLSGHSHEVISGVGIYTKSQSKIFSEKTVITFEELTRSQIEHYVDKYHPLDKAGSYGIQEWIGMIGVSRIEGCYYNVMGLPTSRVWRELKGFE